MKTHTVQDGEDLGYIAKKYKTTTGALARENKLDSSGKVSPGQDLKIPSAQPAPAQSSTRFVDAKENQFAGSRNTGELSRNMPMGAAAEAGRRQAMSAELGGFNQLNQLSGPGSSRPEVQAMSASARTANPSIDWRTAADEVHQQMGIPGNSKELTREQMNQAMDLIGEKYGVNPDFLRRIPQLESGWNQKIAAPPAAGLMQIENVHHSAYEGGRNVANDTIANIAFAAKLAAGVAKEVDTQFQAAGLEVPKEPTKSALMDFAYNRGKGILAPMAQEAARQGIDVHNIQEYFAGKGGSFDVSKGTEPPWTAHIIPGAGVQGNGRGSVMDVTNRAVGQFDLQSVRDYNKDGFKDHSDVWVIRYGKLKHDTDLFKGGAEPSPGQPPAGSGTPAPPDPATGPTPPTPPATSTGGTYTVKPGDTLGRIAQQHGTTWQELQKINNLPDPNRLSVGQVLQVPGAQAPPAPPEPPKTYTVKPGDTLGRIAQQHGTTWQELQKINNLPDPNRLSVGQVLQVPGGSGGTAPQPTPGAEPAIGEKPNPASADEAMQQAQARHINQFSSELQVGGDGRNANCGPTALVMALDAQGMKVEGYTEGMSAGAQIDQARYAMLDGMEGSASRDGVTKDEHGNITGRSEAEHSTYTMTNEIMRGARESGAVSNTVSPPTAEAMKAQLEAGHSLVVLGSFVKKNQWGTITEYKNTNDVWSGDRANDKDSAPGHAQEHFVSVTAYNSESGKFLVQDPARNTPLWVSGSQLEKFMEGYSYSGAITIERPPE